MCPPDESSRRASEAESPRRDANVAGCSDPESVAADSREGPTARSQDRSAAARDHGADRRAFLRAAAAAVATLPLAGCAGLFGDGKDEDTDGTESPLSRPSPRTEAPIDAPDPFDSVTDLTEVGADPTGGSPISEAVNEAATEGELLYLPPGDYLIDEGIDVSEVERFGLVGEQATLIPDDDPTSTLFYVSADGPVLVRNLTFDFTADGVESRALDLRAPDGLDVRDITVRGRLDGGRGPVRVDVRSADGTGVVERLRLPDGSGTEDDVTGCYVGDENQGEVIFRDCRIEGFVDNGLYAEPAVGRITVEGGYYANNGIANVRVCAGSVVRNVRVRCDDAARELDNMRGIRLSNGRPEPEGEPSIVENCRVEMFAVSSSDGGITVGSSLAAAAVRNTDIRVDADDVPAIWAKVPEEELRDAAVTPRFDCADVAVDGEANGGTAVQIEHRSECTLETIDIDQPAAERNGILFQRSSDNVLRDARLNVGGTPILLSDATLRTQNINVGADGIVNQTAEDGSE